TVALIDAWATVADVIAFYQERIANEGFLATAVEPESILALAGLLGRRPRPGLAAFVLLAYTLDPDPADKAVTLTAGMKAQTIPGPGETPQTFETAEALVARPGWNLLQPRSSAPLAVDPTEVSFLTHLTVDGTSAKLSPNDVVLLDFGLRAEPGVLR